MPRIPWTVTVNRILILVNVLVWLVLGIFIILNTHPALPVPPAMRVIMAFMSFAMAAVLIVLFILLLRGSRPAYYLMLLFFSVAALLTILDQVGVSDIVVLILNILPIFFLVLDRKWYLGVRFAEQPSDE
jgi:hypothetical protein